MSPSLLSRWKQRPLTGNAAGWSRHDWLRSSLRPSGYDCTYRSA
ncbi:MULTISPECIES: hypothetical protein [Acetobacter]|uniref:Uncharacterized protein n=1 Tax=Acetobacter lovaniensis TaxID=104100 RepID=A0A841QGL9_9PROT|nr:hypothetical protein [Acetobacter lovaniensis]MBB6457691.1 hypothetical protein [Acetobacter lovaniensis]